MAMKSALIATITAGVLVALLFPSQPQPAEAAQFVRCTAAAVTVTTFGEGTWGTSDRVKREAIASWQATTAQSVGPYYADWNHSLGANVDCKRQLFKVTCVATATPCRV